MKIGLITSNKVATIATHQFITYLTFDNKKERKDCSF